MALQIRGKSDPALTAGGVVTVNVPAGVADGDLLLLYGGMSSGGNFRFQLPNGWNLIPKSFLAGANDIRVWYRVASSEPASYTITGSNTPVFGGMIALYSDTASGVKFSDIQNQTNASSTNRVWPSVTFAAAGILLNFGTFSSSFGTTPPGGSSEQWDTGTGPRAYLMTEVISGAGATGTRTATGTAQASKCVSIALEEGTLTPFAGPQYRSNSLTAAASVNGSIAVSAPPNLAVGDLMTLHLGLATDRTPTLSGWTLEESVTGTFSIYVFTKIAVLGDIGSTITVTLASGATVGAVDVSAVYSPSAKDLYVDAHANQTNTSSTSVVCPSVTPVKGSDLLCLFATHGSSFASTAPEGTAERYEDANGAHLWGASEVLFASGATGTRTATVTSALTSKTVTLAIGERDYPNGTPSGLTLNVISDSQIDVSFTDNSTNETGFEIEEGPDGSSWSLLTTNSADDTTYSHTGLSEHSTHYYRVRAVNADGYSDYTSSASATTDIKAPSGLSATPISQTQIDLSWTDNSGVETGYKVDRSPNGTTGWTQIATPAANATSYSDTGRSEHTIYYYRVRANVSSDNSAYSSTANATTTIYAPSSLSATPVDPTQIDLSWTDNSGVEDGTKIEKSATGMGGWSQIDTVGPGVTTYSDTTLSPGETAYYRVRAYDGSDNSDYSNTANATTTEGEGRVTLVGALAELEYSDPMVIVTLFGVLAEIGSDSINVTLFGVLAELEFAPPMPTYFPPDVQWRHQYVALPEPVTGYQLDAGGSFWSVVIPRASKNLIVSPSLQRIPDINYLQLLGWTDYEISNEKASRGFHSLKLIPLASSEGVAQYLFYPEATGPQNIGFDLYAYAGQGIEVVVEEIDFDPYVFLTAQIAVPQTGWTRYNLTYNEPGPITLDPDPTLITRRMIKIKFLAANTDLRAIYLDGFQVTAGIEDELYFDGDSRDTSFNADPYTYGWDGTAHLSYSRRSARTMSGGYIRSFWDLDFRTTAIMGLGMGDSEPDFIILADGEQILRNNIAGGKEFSIVGSILGCSVYDLQAKRQTLINFLNRLNSTSGGVTLLYQAVNGRGVPLGKRFRLQCAFMSGLGMSFDNNYQENLELRFKLLTGKVEDEFGEVANLELGYEPDPETLFYSQNLQTGEWNIFGVDDNATIGGTIDTVLLTDAGYVYVGGSFTSIGGLALHHIARFNPFTRHWEGVGGGLDGRVTALGQGRGMWEGKIIVGGDFLNAEDEFATEVRRLALYNPATNTWAELDDGLGDVVLQMAVHPSGRVYMVGPFDVNYDLDARFNFVWYDGRIGGDGQGHQVFTDTTEGISRVIIGPDQKVYVAGSFDELGGDTDFNAVASFDPDLEATPLLALSNMNKGLNGAVNDIVFGQDGALYAVGLFTADVASGATVRKFARWTGSVWEEVGGGQITSTLWRIVSDKRGNFYITMDPYDDKGNVDAFSQTYMYGFNGSSWFPVDMRYYVTLDNPTDAMLVSPDGRWFTSVRADNLTFLSGHTVVNNRGTADAQVKLQVIGPCVLHRLSNWTQGKHVYLKGLQIDEGEEFTLDLTGNTPLAYSNFQSDYLNMILAGSSNLNDFRLLPGNNHITLLTSDEYGETTEATLAWNTAYTSIDSALL